MPYANVKELPESLQSALSELGYGRSNIEIEAREKASRFGAGGDGRRCFCCIVDMATGARKTELGSWGGSNAFNPGNAVDQDTTSYVIPPNVAVITGNSGSQHGVFATITLRPEAIAPLLPPAAELTPRERWIIYCFAHLNPRGRKDEFSRYGQKGPSEAELDALAARGFLKRAKNGATQITTEGRNTEGERSYRSVPYAPPT